MKTQIKAKSLGLDHPSVKKVIGIAEEIMSQNKVLSIETLYNRAKKRLKFPKNGLLSIIQLLLDKKILIEGSKFSKGTILKNQCRKRLYNFIMNYPGVHFSILRKRVLCDDLGNVGSSGQLIWHLEMLLRFNSIKKTKVGNYTIFIPFDMDEEVGKQCFLIRDNINKKILNLLINQNSIKKSDVYKLINEKREIVYYRLKNLMEQELILPLKESDKEILINSAKRDSILEVLEKSKDK